MGKIILVMLLGVVLIMLTSWLLDWSFVQGHWIRQGFVILIMLSELLLCVFMVRGLRNLKN